MEDAKAYESEDQEKRDAIGSYNEGENMLYKGEAYLAQHKKELSREQRSELKSAISDLKHSMKRIKPQNITEEQGRAIKEASVNAVFTLVSVETVIFPAFWSSVM